MAKPVIIFGAKGIGKAAMEILLSGAIDILGFLDDDKSLVGKEINNIPILGSTSDEGYLKMVGKDGDSFVALEDTVARKKQVEILVKEYKSMPINAIHDKAYIPESVYLGHGNFVNAGVLIGSHSKVPNHCILNSGVVLEHNVILTDFVQIGAGSIINSDVLIEKGAFIGTGVTIVAGVKIGSGAKVGAGSVVVKDVEKNDVVFGNPAEKVSI